LCHAQQPQYRLQPTSGADPERVWQTVHAGITRLLTDHSLDHTVSRAEQPPQQSAGGNTAP